MRNISFFVLNSYSFQQFFQWVFCTQTYCISLFPEFFVIVVDMGNIMWNSIPLLWSIPIAWVKVRLVFQPLIILIFENSSEIIESQIVFALSALRLMCPQRLKTVMHPASSLSLMPGQEYFEQMGQPKGGFPIQTCVKRAYLNVAYFFVF